MCFIACLQCRVITVKTKGWAESAALERFEWTGLELCENPAHRVNRRAHQRVSSGRRVEFIRPGTPALLSGANTLKGTSKFAPIRALRHKQPSCAASVINLSGQAIKSGLKNRLPGLPHLPPACRVKNDIPKARSNGFFDDVTRPAFGFGIDFRQILPHDAQA
jgi:hypothetical protein